MADIHPHLAESLDGSNEPKPPRQYTAQPGRKLCADERDDSAITTVRALGTPAYSKGIAGHILIPRGEK
ncbi:hypothetical protein E4U40_002907 [Claviceps sp. LM458 group G5]|nr:hypothetical protein E4U40_002907 [Claviceps sp. LM458 group G5]